MTRPLALLVAMALLAAPGFAQTGAAQPAKAHLGDWAFRTNVYAGTCVLSGQMRITQSTGGPLQCRFDAVETCRDRVSKAHQSCVVRRVGNGVTIKSKVLRTNSPSYVPDDFEVEIASPSLMRGMMKSFNSAPVVFRRTQPAIS